MARSTQPPRGQPQHIRVMHAQAAHVLNSLETPSVPAVFLLAFTAELVNILKTTPVANNIGLYGIKVKVRMP